MDVNERDVRMLAVAILTTVNDGGHSPQELASAKESLDEALASLRHAPKASLTTTLTRLAARGGYSTLEIEEAIRTMGARPKPVAAC